MDTSRVLLVVLAAVGVLCTVAAAVDGEEPSCGEDQTMFEGLCYWSDPTLGPYQWKEAEDECKRRGLQLASIHSEQEQEFVYGLNGGWAAWIGLSDSALEGQFRWTDGSPLDFQNWHEGQPSGEDEDCVYLSTTAGWWYDWDCDIGLGVVCKGAPS